MAKKWIINNNEIIMGHVEFHKELVGHHREKEGHKTVGGGYWHHDEENNILYFYGSSDDFGGVRKETFTEALKNSLVSPFLEEAQIRFSNEMWFTNAVNNSVEIRKPDNW